MVKIIASTNTKQEASELSQQLKETFDGFKEELEDHLTAINENTNEIQSNYELISQLSQKLDMMEERLESVELMLNNQQTPQKIEKLSKKEEKIFMVLYREEKNYMSYSAVGAALFISETSARYYISLLTNKGVPIIKKTHNNKTYIKLNSHFRAEQAKQNILGLSPDTTLDMFDQKILR